MAQVSRIDEASVRGAPQDMTQRNCALGALLILAILLPAATSADDRKPARSYFAHPAVEDLNGVIAPWYLGQNGQCDFRLRVGIETLKRYSSNVYGLYRELVDFNRVGTFDVWLNAVPPGGASCRLGPVKALPLVSARLKNPKITFNGAVLEFPVAMESGAYLEFQPGRGCRLYGPGGELRREVVLKQPAPELRPGSNRLDFTCETAPAVKPRARITIGVLGEPTR
jgi:hypothetical protein